MVCGENSPTVYVPDWRKDRGRVAGEGEHETSSMDVDTLGEDHEKVTSLSLADATRSRGVSRGTIKQHGM